MTLKNIHSCRFAGGLIAALLCLATVAQAGPPLICHTIEIGQAKSLPWISPQTGTPAVARFTTLKTSSGDTLEILAPDTPVLVRMETLRPRHPLRPKRPRRCQKNSSRAFIPARTCRGILRPFRCADLVRRRLSRGNLQAVARTKSAAHD